MIVRCKTKYAPDVEQAEKTIGFDVGELAKETKEVDGISLINTKNIRCVVECKDTKHCKVFFDETDYMKIDHSVDEFYLMQMN